jgi:hypothetical protein
MKPHLTCTLLMVSSLSTHLALAQTIDFHGFHPGMPLADFMKLGAEVCELGKTPCLDSSQELMLGSVQLDKPNYQFRYTTPDNVGNMCFAFDGQQLDKAVIAQKELFPQAKCLPERLNNGMVCLSRSDLGVTLLLEHNRNNRPGFCLMSVETAKAIALTDAIEDGEKQGAVAAVDPQTDRTSQTPMPASGTVPSPRSTSQSALALANVFAADTPDAPVGKTYWINERFNNSTSVEFFKSNGEQVHFADSVSFTVLELDSQNPSAVAYKVKVDAAFGPYFLYLRQDEFKRDLFSEQVVSASTAYLAWRRRQYIFTGPPDEILPPIERRLAAVRHAAGATRPAESSKLVTTAEHLVRAQLKDPGSAQFRNVTATHPDSVSLPVICGEVNARNGYGGYVGFVPFLYDANSGKAYLLNLNPTSDDSLESLRAEGVAIDLYGLYCRH